MIPLKKGLLQRMWKQNILKLWLHPQIQPLRAVTTLFVIRCSFMVQRRSWMGDSRTTSPLRSTPVVRLQGEEGCRWLLRSLLDPSPALPSPEVLMEWQKSSVWQSLVKNVSPSFGALRKIWEWSLLPYNLPGGTIPPDWTLGSHDLRL